MTTNSENLSYPHDHQPAPWGVTDPISYGFKRIFSRTWHMWGLSSKKCVRSACRRADISLSHGAFADSYVVLVFGWDSVVVEG
ncbi:hypothetical protein, partial [Corynebacterium sanguinis]|uniref:hypothetical protein n=1 Tax=Corynebacterium sanguinis TaxID=2594913 RepID=UPI002654FC16